MKKSLYRKPVLICILCAVVVPCAVYGEAMLQYFNTSYPEITDRIPELAEAGYTSLWLPPPTKGSGGLSVGYDLWDPLDIGGKDQRGSVSTRYGTEAELLILVETAHRFGIRVYFDNIMNHRAFDIPGYDENTPIDIYPGMVPEDFHLRITEEGFYRKWDNTRDWNSAWQVQNLGLADLIDIAHETPNDNFGYSEGDDHPKISFVRHPDNPEYYFDTDLPINVGYDAYSWNVYTFANKEPYTDSGWSTNGVTTNGAYNGRFDWDDVDGDGQHDAGETSEPFEDTGLDPTRPGWNTTTYGYGDGIYNMGDPVVEDVGACLIREVCWLMDRTKADGLRLDAVKHVPSYFFGEYNSDTSDAGYLGGAQRQFNITRGFSDWGNHRDTVFNTEAPRDDAMMFGEHLGEPPGYSEYISAGMRLVDNPLRTELNGKLGSPWGGLYGYDQPGAGGFSPDHGVMHAQSHDNDYAARRELQHAFYFTRAGLGLLYTDGNHHAETLGESGGAFPRHANTSFLGQWDDNRIPNLLYIHEQFGRGFQKGVKGDDPDYVAYERLDWRQGGSTDGDKVVMLFILNDDYSNGHARDIRGNIDFGHTPFVDDQYLYNYSSYGGGFYTYASELHNVIVPAGGYFAFSWKNPDPSFLWSCFGGNPISIYQNDQIADTIDVVRKDGPDGDPDFNPYNLPDTNSSDYAYTIAVPRITSGTNLRFTARVDGSANNVLMKLDGGVDINSQMGEGPLSGDLRDHSPANADDVFLGYEQPAFHHRQHREKFAAVDSLRNKIGSAGAETYIMTAGTPGFTFNAGDGANDYDNTYTASWIWHDPTNFISASGYSTTTRHVVATSTGITFWVKMGDGCDINRMFLYYTTDGAAWPEGVGGEGYVDTHVAEFQFAASDSGNASHDWWSLTLSGLTNGTPLRYKIGAAFWQGCDYACNSEPDCGWDVPFPNSPEDVARKAMMMSMWEATNFNAQNVSYRPHADWGGSATGLVEGFHMLSVRAFLQRDGGASIYNTFKQTFYYDVERPEGTIVWPASDGDSVSGQEYGVVVRTDPSVREVWVHIDDANTNNDDVVTGVANGNGTGFEPYVDGNSSGDYDLGEDFKDLNDNSVWDSDVGESWVKASPQTPTDMSTEYPGQWRFTYVNIPAGGSNATVSVRLREWSSAGRADFTNHTDSTGHFTTLERNVYTWGPDIRMFVAWPQKDGDVVGSGYEMKTYFTKSLADGLSESELIDQFLIRIQSSESGRTTGGVGQARDDYSISWDETADYHALEFSLTNLYNGEPDWLHGLEVTMSQPSPPDLVATRFVKAAPAEVAPYVAIIEPPEYGPDGKQHQIIIPDVLNPSNEQRRTSLRVATQTNAASVSIAFDSVPDGYYSQGGGVSFLGSTNEGSSVFWDYMWSNLVAGTYRFKAWVTTGGGVSNSASRNAIVVKREWVNANTNDLDDDDDGLSDIDEATSTPLPNQRQESPEPNPENWDNGEVHVHYAYGKSLPLSPDSDGDGLPDGLEVGWRHPGSNTDTNADTNGDGYPNFLSDIDPPFFNTLDNYGRVPGVNSQSEGGDRAKLLYGSMTDPANEDSDYDGLSDGTEDANRNGWVDGDGSSIAPDELPENRSSWPNRVMDGGETWTETDPNNSDTDDDGLSDGYGEDKDFNGLIAGDSNSNRIYDAGEAWSETDPLNRDTDGDGLPDGWEAQFNLDALDDGTNSMRTATADDGVVVNGAAGDPDNDGFGNLTELLNGTRPDYEDTGVPPPEGTITIGAGPVIGMVAGQTNYQEFMDWSEDDLLALDEYNNGAYGAVDIYRAWDGWDTSRDLVAFYAHDGGDSGEGGDDMFYFRVDFHDLQAQAEEQAVDVYVVIDMNSPGNGEFALPDEVDIGTDMKWEVVVALYGWNNGRVYVDDNPANNSSSVGEDLTAYGVLVRDQSSANGFGQSYWNASLDAVEFSISRQALLDGGWNGLDPDQLNYQVFSTKVGTGNDPQGPGDIGGRNDVRDTFTDDWISSDYWRDQVNIQENGRLYSWLGRSANNDYGKSAKVAMMVHGNQAIQPGSVVQDLINNGTGAGYHRTLDAHEVYQQPLNLHITPTLASALEWARVDTNLSPLWRDGPAFNDRMSELVATNIVDVLGTTFSDHMLPYFTSEFNEDNERLAADYLEDIYGYQQEVSTVFWPSERLLDANVFQKITNMGYSFTVIDQNTHMWNWFGRTPALSDDGYRINKIHGVYCFVINNQASGYRFQNNDSGLPMAMRELLNRRARGSVQDQIVTILSNWEDFGVNAQADAYDLNLRWLANHPWTRLVLLGDVAGGEVDLNGDGSGDFFSHIDRGAPAISKQGHDWLNHATEGNYDNWYVGSGQEQGLQNTVFEIRPDTNLPQAYGMLYFGGIVSDAWTRVQSVADSNVARLARSAMHASVFETGFHNEDNNNLQRFSTGDYIYPDGSWDGLIGFARYAQSQTRIAAIYKEVDDWAAVASSVTTPQLVSKDVDLDGEDEYLLYNDRLFGLFERIGGRMLGVWVRDLVGGGVYQATGNPVSYSGSDTEEEGVENVTVDSAIGSFRTSCLKDWWVGTSQYVNDLYGVSSVTDGWEFTSSDGKVQKTITLGTNSWSFEVNYTVGGDLAGQALYIRNGLSPHLDDLLSKGQATLTDVENSDGKVVLLNTNYGATVAATIGYGDAGHSAGYNGQAVDDNPGTLEFFTINMRNQAQTHQVELVGTNSFAFSLGFRAYGSDYDGDGIPNSYEDDVGLDSADGEDAEGDSDSDRYSNYREYVADTDPENPASYLAGEGVQTAGTIRVRFDTSSNRKYYIWYANDSSMDDQWILATSNAIPGTGTPYEWIDDGSQTAPAPDDPSLGTRIYRIQVALPD